MTALIAEDNVLQSKVLQELFKEEGITSIIAEDGRKALELLETEKIDIIISDVHMPTMDGLSLLYIVKRDAKFKHIPFVIYSSKPQESDMQLAYKLKVNAFVEEDGIRGVLPVALNILNKSK